MNSKEMSNDTVKMYWQEVPCENDQIRNILPTGVYCEPANIVNSTHVNVDAKPWLQKTNLKKENTKAVSQQSKQTIPKSKVSRKNNDWNEEQSIGGKKSNTTTSNQPSHAACSLAELRKEDKQRVAGLVREMAKFSEEKEMAVNELNNLKSDFTAKLKTVEDEKQKMIKERDVLKEKLLRCELVLSEIKDSRKNSNQNGVDTILNNHVSLQDVSEVFQGFGKVTNINQHTSPEEYPGNSKEPKYKVDVDNNSENDLKCEDDTKHVPGDNVEDIDKLTVLFFKQQDKFHCQQEILQTQIEQLQKLQEGILQQQEQHLKEKLLDTKKEAHYSQTNPTPLHGLQHTLHKTLFNEPSKHKHSQKLQNYISKQSEVDTEVSKENNLKKMNDLSQILVEDTITEEKNKDNTLISMHCLNATSILSSTDTAVQTEHNVFMPEDDVATKSKEIRASKADICVGTDDVCEVMDVDDCQSKYGMKTLELCKTHVNKLGEVLKNLSSDKLVQKTNINNQKTVSKVNKRILLKKFISEPSIQKEMPLIADSLLDDDSDEDNNAVRKENNSLSSALQQQHFQPASMLELIDGIEPPSASTSISSSFKKVSPVNECRHRTPLSPTNGQGKAKVKHERAAKLQKVYGAIKNKHGILKRDHAKEKSLEDIEEQKMIADVFFVK